jgi:hypothetical protein
MKNPAMIIPDAGQAIGALVAALRRAGLPEATANLFNRLNATTKQVAGAWQ